MTAEEVAEGTNIIRTRIPDFEYDRIYARAHDTAQMISALSYKPSKGATLGATPKRVKLGQKGHSEKEEEKKKNR